MQLPHPLNKLTGYHLQAQDGEVGRLKQIYFDDQYWVVRYFVVRTGAWLTGRDVLIVPAVIAAVDEKRQCFKVELSRAQIQNCPPVNTALPISRHYEQEYFRYYGWEPYWHGESLFEPVPVQPVSEDNIKDPTNPHLRSSKEVEGYSIHALDGEIGHVEDFILEQPDWPIRYLEVDIGKWLPGKKVLVAPPWIHHVDWANKAVKVDLTREAIESAPPYDPSKIISREYQVALYGHYGKTFTQE